MVAIPLWEVILAACSLLVSIIALGLSYRAQREANAAQRQMLAIEQERERERQMHRREALLQAQLRAVSRGSYRLYLVNRGEAEARNVRIRLDGRPISEHCAAVQGETLPYRVGPDSEVSCLMGISHDCSPPFDLEVLWDDDSGSDRAYRTTLTL